MQPEFLLSTTIEDEDWDPLFVLQWHCFKDSPQSAAFSPGGLDPAAREANILGLKIGVFGGPVERAYAKLTETRSGDIASFISCRVWRGPLGIIDGEHATPPPPQKLPNIKDEKEREFWEWYWTSFNIVMREIKEMQVPHIYIQVLCTDPAWQGHGAASRLLQWIFEFAAKERLGSCVLQCTPNNKGFYERFGFKAVGTHTYVDEKLFPGRIGPTIVQMVKQI